MQNKWTHSCNPKVLGNPLLGKANVPLLGNSPKEITQVHCKDVCTPVFRSLDDQEPRKWINLKCLSANARRKMWHHETVQHWGERDRKMFSGNMNELGGLKSSKIIRRERQILHECICVQNLKFTLRSLDHSIVIIRLGGCRREQVGGLGETGQGLKVTVRYKE